MSVAKKIRWSGAKAPLWRKLAVGGLDADPASLAPCSDHEEGDERHHELSACQDELLVGVQEEQILRVCVVEGKTPVDESDDAAQRNNRHAEDPSSPPCLLEVDLTRLAVAGHDRRYRDEHEDAGVCKER